MHIVIIAAIGRDRAIGMNGDLPWHLPADIAFFHRQIEGCYLLSGRRSYDSPQGREMFTPDRQVIVVTRQKDFTAPPHVVLADSVEKAIRIAAYSGAKKLCVLGGAEIYNQTIGLADELVITEVEAVFPEADSFFPPIDKANWVEIWREEHPRDAENPWDYAFVRYKRRAAGADAGHYNAE